MKVTEITVHAARTIPHPTLRFTTMRPSITVRATIEDDKEDYTECALEIQAEVESLMERLTTELLSPYR